GSGDSYALANHFEKNALSGNVGRGLFPTSYIMKDMKLASEMARRHRLPAAFGALSLAVYRGTCALGHKDHYFPLALRWMEQAANMAALTPDPKE
ncbi:MAG: hypothetical protein EXQ96_06155, partial [Alphaproteobacteria bacterium]|nr:hypothetical protein [Alphaproteobacteria bacterium]